MASIGGPSGDGLTICGLLAISRSDQVFCGGAEGEQGGGGEALRARGARVKNTGEQDGIENVRRAD